MINTTQDREHAIQSQYPYWLVLKRCWMLMLGTCESIQPVTTSTILKNAALTWFCYDLVTYPFGPLSSTIMERLEEGHSTIQNIGYGMSPYPPYTGQQSDKSDRNQLSQPPGCLVGGLLMGRTGRKLNMTLGFFIWAAWGFILGDALKPIQIVFPLFVVMYGIFNALGEMGLSVSIFRCSAESFPTLLWGRSLVFSWGSRRRSGKQARRSAPKSSRLCRRHSTPKPKVNKPAVFQRVGLWCNRGLAVWFMIPGMSQELKTEDVRSKAYLAEHGYSISHHADGEPVVNQAAFPGK